MVELCRESFEEWGRGSDALARRLGPLTDWLVRPTLGQHVQELSIRGTCVLLYENLADRDGAQGLPGLATGFMVPVRWVVAGGSDAEDDRALPASIRSAASLVRDKVSKLLQGNARGEYEIEAGTCVLQPLPAHRQYSWNDDALNCNFIHLALAAGLLQLIRGSDPIPGEFFTGMIGDRYIGRGAIGSRLDAIRACGLHGAVLYHPPVCIGKPIKFAPDLVELQRKGKANFFQQLDLAFEASWRRNLLRRAPDRDYVAKTLARVANLMADDPEFLGAGAQRMAVELLVRFGLLRCGQMTRADWDSTGNGLSAWLKRIRNEELWEDQLLREVERLAEDANSRIHARRFNQLRVMRRDDAVLKTVASWYSGLTGPKADGSAVEPTQQALHEQPERASIPSDSAKSRYSRADLIRAIQGAVGTTLVQTFTAAEEDWRSGVNGAANRVNECLRLTPSLQPDMKLRENLMSALDPASRQQSHDWEGLVCSIKRAEVEAECGRLGLI